MKIITYLFVLLLMTSLVVNKAYASAIFQDNFESGNANQWTSVLGPNLWQVKQINGSYRYGATVADGSTIIDSIAGNIISPNYTIEYDYLALTGEDKNIDFRWVNNSPLYEVHFTNAGALFVGSHSSIGTAFVPYVLQNGTQYHIKIVLQNQHIQLFVNTDKVFDLIDTNYQFSGDEQVGLRIGTGSTFPTEAYFDNIVVTNLDSSDLAVPLLKQISNPWQSQEYDTAHLWNPGNPTINAWGCAMTSAAMILQYYGIATIPGTNFTPLNPGTLNTWLKSQPDGYLGTGWVNWLAIARLSKLAADEGIVSSFDALEYSRTSGANKTQLTDDINNNIPDILEEPGHFIVAKGINGNTFNINDPFYNLTSLDNTRYNNTFLSLGRFTPSHTDLSYIMLTSDPSVTLTIKDSQGNTVGSSFVQSSIVDPLDASKTNSPIRIYYLPKPTSGNYTITANNTAGPFTFTSYLYDAQGNPTKQTQNGIGNTQFLISFDKTNSTNTKIVKKVTYASALQDIKTAQNLHLINVALAVGLSEILKNAEKQSSKHSEIARAFLKSGIKLLNDSKNYSQLISKDTYTILLNDFTILYNAL